jgi:hypothetical protein
MRRRLGSETVERIRDVTTTVNCVPKRQFKQTARNRALMKTGKRYHAVMVYCCAAVLAFAGCASPSGGSGVGSLQGLAPLPSIASDAASVANVAGKYRGKFLLKRKTIGDAYFDLTQSGTAIGGTLRLVLSTTVREPVALTLDAANNSFTGSATDPSDKSPCTYTLSGSYNPKTAVLRGTSSPLTCAGKVANFTATQSCYYNTSPSATARRRPDARGVIEC